MSTTTTTKTPTPAGVPGTALRRILDEGFGPDAWYGAGLGTAIADVTPAAAFRRPADGRHSIAEIALHHAYWARDIRRKLTGAAPEAFPVPGEDWFDLAEDSPLTWLTVVATVDAEQRRLAEAVDAIATGRTDSPLEEKERFDLVVGITGHAAYHAGQIQLLKKLLADTRDDSGTHLS